MERSANAFVFARQLPACVTPCNHRIACTCDASFPGTPLLCAHAERIITHFLEHKINSIINQNKLLKEIARNEVLVCSASFPRRFGIDFYMLA
jgi:hypothetical protein